MTGRLIPWAIATMLCSAAMIPSPANSQEQAPLTPLMEQINGGNWLTAGRGGVASRRAFLPARHPRLHHDAAGAQRHRHARRLRGGVRSGLQRPADLEGPDGLPRLGADAERRRHLFDELSRPEGNRPARRRRAAERDRHVHRLLPAHDHRCRRDRPGSGARRALSPAAARLRG